MDAPVGGEDVHGALLVPMTTAETTPRVALPRHQVLVSSDTALDSWLNSGKLVGPSKRATANCQFQF